MAGIMTAMKKKPTVDDAENPAEDAMPGDMGEDQGGMTPDQENPAEDAAPGDAAEDQGESQGGEKPNVTPEEQAQYEKFVDNCYSSIYDPKAFPAIQKALQATEDPLDNLAHTVVGVVTRVVDSAQKANAPLDDAVIFQGGVEVMEDLADLSAKLGIHEFTEDELQSATYRALDMYREQGIATGKIDPNDLKQQFDTIREADQRGMLGQLMPGLEQYAQQHQQPEGAPPEGDQPMEQPQDQGA